MDTCDLDIVKKLVKYGAKVNTKNNEGKTALMHAADCVIRPDELINFLISQGANPGVKDNKWNTLLIRSLEGASGAFETVLKLSGIGINEKNNKGYTALMIAIYNKHNGYAKALLDEGANIKLKSKDGLTAIDLAYKANNSYMLWYINTVNASKFA